MNTRKRKYAYDLDQNDEEIHQLDLQSATSNVFISDSIREEIIKDSIIQIKLSESTNWRVKNECEIGELAKPSQPYIGVKSFCKVHNQVFNLNAECPDGFNQYNKRQRYEQPTQTLQTAPPLYQECRQEEQSRQVNPSRFNISTRRPGPAPRIPDDELSPEELAKRERQREANRNSARDYRNRLLQQNRRLEKELEDESENHKNQLQELKSYINDLETKLKSQLNIQPTTSSEYICDPTSYEQNAQHAFNGTDLCGNGGIEREKLVNFEVENEIQRQGQYGNALDCMGVIMNCDNQYTSTDAVDIQNTNRSENKEQAVNKIFDSIIASVVQYQLGDQNDATTEDIMSAKNDSNGYEATDSMVESFENLDSSAFNAENMFPDLSEKKSESAKKIDQSYFGGLGLL